MNVEAVGTALRVLGHAVQRGLVVDRPGGVVVYARQLEPAEIRWLYLGMDGPAVEDLPLVGARGEDVQIVGAILGRVYRVALRAEEHAGLLADLRVDLYRRSQDGAR